MISDQDAFGVPSARDIDIERTEWRPSAARLARYREREVALAKRNLRALGVTDTATARIAILPSSQEYNTKAHLHSWATLAQAVRETFTRMSG